MCVCWMPWQVQIITTSLPNSDESPPRKRRRNTAADMASSPRQGGGGLTHEAADHSAAPDSAAAGGAAGASEGSKAKDNDAAMNDGTGTRGVGGSAAPVLVAGLQDESTTADYAPPLPTKGKYPADDTPLNHDASSSNGAANGSVRGGDDDGGMASGAEPPHLPWCKQTYVRIMVQVRPALSALPCALHFTQRVANRCSVLLCG
jgi:hypothetical protein